MREWGVLVPILGTLIPIIALLLIPMKQFLRLKEKQLLMASELTAEKSAQYAAHTERLEQRVRVLERIITDKGAGVASEIELLRDNPLN
jgi:ABC-type phosphate transport system auxiliary subunit